MSEAKINWITTTEALKIAKEIGHPITLPTIIAWIARYPNLGLKIGGRWKINKDALIFYLIEGTD
jgi:hypothetical protein